MSVVAPSASVAASADAYAAAVAAAASKRVSGVRGGGSVVSASIEHSTIARGRAVFRKPFNKKKAETFHLVSRSHNDPLAADPNASQRVLRPTTGKVPSDFPRDLLSDSKWDVDPAGAPIGYSALFGDPLLDRERRAIVAKLKRMRGEAVDDEEEGALPHDYDYSKHMRVMGGGVFIPAHDARVPTDLRTGPVVRSEADVEAGIAVPEDDADGAAARPKSSVRSHLAAKFGSKPKAAKPAAAADSKESAAATKPAAGAAPSAAPSADLSSISVITAYHEFSRKGKTRTGIIADGIGHIDDVLQALDDRDDDGDADADADGKAPAKPAAAKAVAGKQPAAAAPVEEEEVNGGDWDGFVAAMGPVADRNRKAPAKAGKTGKSAAAPVDHDEGEGEGEGEYDGEYDGEGEYDDGEGEDDGKAAASAKGRGIAGAGKAVAKFAWSTAGAATKDEDGDDDGEGDGDGDGDEGDNGASQRPAARPAAGSKAAAAKPKAAAAPPAGSRVAKSAAQLLAEAGLDGDDIEGSDDNLFDEEDEEGADGGDSKSAAGEAKAKPAVKPNIGEAMHMQRAGNTAGDDVDGGGDEGEGDEGEGDEGEGDDADGDGDGGGDEGDDAVEEAAAALRAEHRFVDGSRVGLRRIGHDAVSSRLDEQFDRVLDEEYGDELVGDLGSDDDTAKGAVDLHDESALKKALIDAKPKRIADAAAKPIAAAAADAKGGAAAVAATATPAAAGGAVRAADGRSAARGLDPSLSSSDIIGIGTVQARRTAKDAASIAASTIVALQRMSDEPEVSDAAIDALYVRPEPDHDDCESIISTFSNLENRPNRIAAAQRPKRNARPQITLNKMGIPIDYLPGKSAAAPAPAPAQPQPPPVRASRRQQHIEQNGPLSAAPAPAAALKAPAAAPAAAAGASPAKGAAAVTASAPAAPLSAATAKIAASAAAAADDDDDDGGDDGTNAGRARDRNESAADKKARKSLVKAQRKLARAVKKQHKTALAGAEADVTRTLTVQSAQPKKRYT